LFYFYSILVALNKQQVYWKKSKNQCENLEISSFKMIIPSNYSAVIAFSCQEDKEFKIEQKKLTYLRTCLSQKIHLQS